MAVRALIPAERLNIAHVNSVDGSTDYESGTEYKAGTVVTYNSNTYVANIDIEDTDTDTPDAAADKWGLCPNAKSLVEGGEVADLENRVAALENTVGDETAGLVKDVDDLQEDVIGNTIIVEDKLVNVKASTGTVADLLYSLSTAIGNVLSSMASNETLEVYRINLQSYVNILPQLKILSNQSYADLYGLGVEPSATTCNIFRLKLDHGSVSDNILRQCHLDSTGNQFLTPSDDIISTELTFTAYYRKFRKIS